MMFYYLKKVIIGSAWICGVCFLFSSVLSAEEGRDMGGWEIDGIYNEHYDPAELDSIKGVVLKIKEIVPLKGMVPGVALEVRERNDDEVYLVHLCPVWYKKPKQTGIRRGDKVKVNGVFVEMNGEEVIMAAKVKKGQWQFKVRLTSDGTPFWTMSKEQLDKELKSQ